MRILVLAGGFDQIALINELKSRGHFVILADYYENPMAKSAADKHLQVSTLDVDMIEKIEKIVNAVDGVQQCHDVRVRSSGAEYEIDVNIHVKSTLTIVEAHDISENVEAEIRKKLGDCGVITIHTEPDC